MQRGKAPRRAFLRDERGVTMLEFAILGPVFFVIIGAILETSMVFLASQVLDNAVQDASRLIRTGQAQTANYTIDDYRAAICNELFNLFNCNNLQINVSVVNNFASANAGPPLDPTDPTKWKLKPAFIPGTGSQVVMAQVYYKWPLILNIAGLNIGANPDGTRLLGTVRVFANEPFT